MPRTINIRSGPAMPVKAKPVRGRPLSVGQLAARKAWREATAAKAAQAAQAPQPQPAKAPEPAAASAQKTQEAAKPNAG